MYDTPVLLNTGMHRERAAAVLDDKQMIFAFPKLL